MVEIKYNSDTWVVMIQFYMLSMCILGDVHVLRSRSRDDAREVRTRAVHETTRLVRDGAHGAIKRIIFAVSVECAEIDGVGVVRGVDDIERDDGFVGEPGKDGQNVLGVKWRAENAR
jgi:hypothetical protein